mmetsp:Transcript_26304/g.46651  ORF Transcript_26304/g.46651 Transcript_26304/m.46651 type:complete len:339 (+) Transcript_26304:177-1193(+)
MLILRTQAAATRARVVLKQASTAANAPKIHINRAKNLVRTTNICSRQMSLFVIPSSCSSSSSSSHSRSHTQVNHRFYSTAKPATETATKTDDGSSSDSTSTPSMSVSMERKSKKPQAVTYDLPEAVRLVKAFATARFDETVEVCMRLGVDPRKPNQMVRGLAELPHGLGRTVRIAVFAKGAKAEEAKSAGADIVGAEDLAEKIKGGEVEFDRVIATPDCMGIVGTVARILGPRGLMPNPKMGTITMDIEQGIQASKQGQVSFKCDRNGQLSAPVGKVSFSDEALISNISSFVKDVNSAKPSAATGQYFKNVTLTSTMGKGFRLDLKMPPFTKPKGGRL